LNCLTVLLIRGRRRAAVEYAEAASARYSWLGTRFKYLSGREAAALRNLSWRRRALGDLVLAKDAALRANAILEELVKEVPDRFNFELADGLRVISAHTSALGMYEEACEIAFKSVSLYRSLSEVEPRRFRFDLALALIDHSRRLTDILSERALDTVKEGVEILKPLNDHCPGRYKSDYARGLQTQGDVKESVGDRQGAISDEVTVVGLWRELLPTAPDRYSGELAAALRTLGLRYRSDRIASKRFLASLTLSSSMRNYLS